MAEVKSYRKDRYICFCKWCGEMPCPSYHSSEVSCINCNCIKYGYRCKSTEAWNDVMLEADRELAGTCPHCNNAPDVYGIKSGDTAVFYVNENCSDYGKIYSLKKWIARGNSIKSSSATKSDSVNHPSHYNWFGVECMEVVKFFDFVLGNVIKYVWRAGFKSTSTKLEDLKKARYYIDIAITEEEIAQKTR